MTQWGLDTLFNPAKRHMDDEKQRLQSTREEVGDNSGGRRVDLESGRVVIRRPENEDQDDQPDAGQDVEQPREQAGVAKSTTPPSPAAQRAAARRGRTAR